MSDDHLFALEGAARFYCEKSGLDPDQQFERPRQTGLILPGHQPKETRPRWKFVAEELLDMHIRLQALQIAQRDAQMGRAANEPTRVQ